MKYPKINDQIAFLTRVSEVGEDRIEWRSYDVGAELQDIAETPWTPLSIDTPKFRDGSIVETRLTVTPQQMPAAALPPEDPSGEYKVEVMITNGKMMLKRQVLRFGTEDHARDTLLAMLAREGV